MLYVPAFANVILVKAVPFEVTDTPFASTAVKSKIIAPGVFAARD
jgi:hypothetical protein